MDRRWERIGGWASIAVGVCGVGRLVAAASLYAAVATVHGGHPAGAQAIHATSLWLTLVDLAAALALVGAARGVARAFRPSTRLITTVAILGYAAALLALTSALATGLRVAAPSNDGLWLGLLTGFSLALWITGVCAADWRLRRLPTWLRIVGSLFAFLSFLTPLLNLFVLLAVPLGLVWWFGLGAALLRSPDRVVLPGAERALEPSA